MYLYKGNKNELLQDTKTDIYRTVKNDLNKDL